MKKEVCNKCTHYYAYYRQRTCGYENLGYGICQTLNEQHKKSDTCEKFNHNELKEKRRKEILYFSLECAIKSINEIADIIKEKEE